MELHYIHQLRNAPIDSNCYIIHELKSERCILVDPALSSGGELICYLDVRRLVPDYIIITHEHFDHISSVECLRIRYHCPLIASQICSELITNPKKNLSMFQDGVGFACKPAERGIQTDGERLDWRGAELIFYLTPGHSPGGLSFAFKQHLFTGDTWMEGYATPTKLPGGNTIALRRSQEFLKGLCMTPHSVHPGHGASFVFSTKLS